jgi:hypothetical protein
VPPVKIVLQREMTHGEEVGAKELLGGVHQQYTLQAQLGEMKNTFHIVHFCLTKESAEVAAAPETLRCEDEVFLRDTRRQKCNSTSTLPLSLFFFLLTTFLL